MKNLLKYSNTFVYNKYLYLVNSHLFPRQPQPPILPPIYRLLFQISCFFEGGALDASAAPFKITYGLVGFTHRRSPAVHVVLETHSVLWGMRVGKKETYLFRAVTFASPPPLPAILMASMNNIFCRSPPAAHRRRPGESYQTHGKSFPHCV